jgi:hypothetical protein
MEYDFAFKNNVLYVIEVLRTINNLHFIKTLDFVIFLEHHTILLIYYFQDNRFYNLHYRTNNLVFI